MKRVELYKLILASVNVEIGDNDQLIVKKGEAQDPIIYDGKGFYLPTKENLAKPSAETADYLFFDPLTESAVRQESESTKMLKQLMTSRLQVSVSVLLTNLLMILRDENNAALAKGNQTLLYRQGFNPSTTTMRSFTSMLRNGVKDNVTNRLVNIFLKRGGTIDGERFSRVAKITFPILDAFKNTTNGIFGVDMSARDKENILKLFSYIVYGVTEPIVDDTDEFSAGSNSKMAPYFQAMCFAYCNVARRLNHINKTYMELYESKKGISVADLIHIDLTFEEHIQELNQYKKDPMPLLPGNSGTIKQSHMEKPNEKQVIEEPTKPVPETKVEDKTGVSQKTPQVVSTNNEQRSFSGKQFISQDANRQPSTTNGQLGRPMIPQVVSNLPNSQVVQQQNWNNPGYPQPANVPQYVNNIPQGQTGYFTDQYGNIVDQYGNLVDPRFVQQQNHQPWGQYQQYGNNQYPQGVNYGYNMYPQGQQVNPYGVPPNSQVVQQQNWNNPGYLRSERLEQANRVKNGIAPQPISQGPINRYTGLYKNNR